MSSRSREAWQKMGVLVGSEVDPDRIAADATIHSGSCIRGGSTSIAAGCIIGAESPATVEDCQLGRGVELKGGFHSGSVFFEGASMGSGAHIRAGCILEEESGGAHSVGLKQTVFLPFVTAGSLINFCDALMAGGTSRRNHSEIGSSYIHFNFTPHQDKATASLVGDVPTGVFLDRPPIFLGGQGGLVGPARLAFGTVVAAGGVCREDILTENQLHVPAQPPPVTRDYEAGVYRRIDRIVVNNLAYIGNIKALLQWYRHVRPLFVRDRFDQAVLDGGIANLKLILDERVARLGAVANKMAASIHGLEKQANASRTEIEAQARLESEWSVIERRLRADCDEVDRSFVDVVRGRRSDDYVGTIQGLDAQTREAGRHWLQSIVDRADELWR